MEIIAASGKLVSADVVELKLILAHRNHTGILAVELIGSLLSKSIF